VTKVLADLDELIARSAPAERPALVVQLAARLAQLGATLTDGRATEQPAVDRNLDVAEAAQRMGMSARYLYRNARRFSFTIREGRRLLFSEHGLARYMAQRTGKA
jgi:hypothetical protein